MPTTRPLAPESSQGLGLTYSEAVSWASWLVLFTLSDFADAMGVSLEMAARAMRALEFHGVCFDTGDSLAGESIFGYRTFQYPADPNEHPSAAPEWRTCRQDLVPPNRGVPVRLVVEDRRRQSTTGDRHRMMVREKRYDAMMQARERSQMVAKRKQLDAQGREIHRRKVEAAKKRKAKAELKRRTHPLVV